MRCGTRHRGPVADLRADREESDRLVSGGDVSHNERNAPALLLKERRALSRQSFPGQRIAGDYELLVDDQRLVRLSGLVENERRSVEDRPLGPDRKKHRSGLVVDEREAAMLIGQRSRRRYADDPAVGRGGDFQRVKGLNSVRSASGKKQRRQPSKRFHRFSLSGTSMSQS